MVQKLSPVNSENRSIAVLRELSCNYLIVNLKALLAILAEARKVVRIVELLD